MQIVIASGIETLNTYFWHRVGCFLKKGGKKIPAKEKKPLPTPGILWQDSDLIVTNGKVLKLIYLNSDAQPNLCKKLSVKRQLWITIQLKCMHMIQFIIRFTDCNCHAVFMPPRTMWSIRIY